MASSKSGTRFTARTFAHGAAARAVGSSRHSCRACRHANVRRHRRPRGRFCVAAGRHRALRAQRLDPLPFDAVGDRFSMVCGERGLTADVTAHAAARLRRRQEVVLAGYEAPGWADVVADRTDEIAREMSGFLGGSRRTLPPTLLAKARLPASPIASRARARRWCCCRSSSRHRNGRRRCRSSRERSPSLPWVDRIWAASRPSRIAPSAPTYQAMFRTLIDLMAPAPGRDDPRCRLRRGSLDRLLARRLGSANTITAIDTNPFLLNEAASLAKAEGLDGRSASTRQCGDGAVRRRTRSTASFRSRCLRSATRTARWPKWSAWRAPDGRVGVIVRSLDLPQWWNVTVPGTILRQDHDTAAIGRGQGRRRCQPLSSGAGGGTGRPHLLSVAGDPRPARRPDLALSRGPFAGAAHGRGNDDLAGRARGRERQGLLFMAHPMHCVVGHKPLRRRPKA